MNRVALLLTLTFGFVSATEARHVDIVPYYEVDAVGHRTLSVGAFDLAGDFDGTQSIERNAMLFYGEAVPAAVVGNRVNGDPGWNRPFDFHSPLEGE